MKKKILYLIHVPWGWIKQRPHFIAEGLSEDYDLTVIARKEFKSSVAKNCSYVKVVSLFRLPFERISFIAMINSFLYKIQLYKSISKSDVIWLTSPLQIDIISSCLNKILVYDCMDDVIEFPISNTMKNKLRNKERLLFERANLVFSSSEFLRKKLLSRYNWRNVEVINNALRTIPQSCTSKIEMHDSLKYYFESKKIKIVYIGTIASWLDFTLVEKILDYSVDFEFYLYGPTEVTIPNFDRLYYCKTVEHHLVFPIMESSTVLIMPFIVNELIRSVNPVKLYEYIASGKPSFAPFYEESRKFEEYVYLYRSNEECLQMIEMLVGDNFKNKKDYSDCVSFAENNTWSVRLGLIKKKIDNELDKIDLI